MSKQFGDIALTPGDRVLRSALHDQVGGSRQSGITHPKGGSVVLLFSNPSGPKHGYVDGWHSDGYFHYSGEGQRGDQVMSRGNKTIREHRDEGRELQLFGGTEKRGEIEYIGQFHLVDWYRNNAPQTGGGPIREIIVFRLAPDTTPGTDPPRRDPKMAVGAATPEEQLVETVPVEDHQTERYCYHPTLAPTEAEKREADLVYRFKAHRANKGVQLERLKIRIPGERYPLFTDLFDDASNTLIEAKGSVTREAVRMAIGQLCDYGRWLSQLPHLVILLPERPRQDLVELAHAAGADIVYAAGEDFYCLSQGAAGPQGL